MSKYRTAMGKSIDMASLAAKNEKTRAVGNMKVNARGDTIDAEGKVILPATKKVGKAYKDTVSKRAVNLTKEKKQNEVKIEGTSSELLETSLTPEELEIERNLDEELEVEKIKQESIKVKPASEAPDFFKPE